MLVSSWVSFNTYSVLGTVLKSGAAMSNNHNKSFLLPQRLMEKTGNNWQIYKYILSLCCEWTGQNYMSACNRSLAQPRLRGGFGEGRGVWAQHWRLHGGTEAGTVCVWGQWVKKDIVSAALRWEQHRKVLKEGGSSRLWAQEKHDYEKNIESTVDSGELKEERVKYRILVYHLREWGSERVCNSHCN
jgi:hypothetical protein